MGDRWDDGVGHAGGHVLLSGDSDHRVRSRSACHVESEVGCSDSECTEVDEVLTSDGGGVEAVDGVAGGASRHGTAGTTLQQGHGVRFAPPYVDFLYVADALPVGRAGGVAMW